MTAKLIAAGAALSVTLSLVWSMGTLGYPPNAKAAAPAVLAQACR
jgi:hypothetical protein